MKVVFMGTPAAAVPSLSRLMADGQEVRAVYTQPDRPAGRGKRLHASPVKEFATAHGLTVLQPSKIRTADVLETFRSHGADVAIVVAYGRILPDGFLTAFPHGAINVHFSLLPKYRGAAPVNWAIANGETGAGVTTMRMDAGLDTGDILLQRSTPIGENETSVDLMSRLADLGSELLSETLSALGTIEPRPQADAEATYAPILTKEDGRIEWSLTAAEIARRVRGFQPFPTAWSTFGGKHVTIWRASSIEAVHGGRTHGEIVEAKGDTLVVACGGNTFLRIDELQTEGKRRMSARDFINGARPAVGELFGGA